MSVDLTLVLMPSTPKPKAAKATPKAKVTVQAPKAKAPRKPKGPAAQHPLHTMDPNFLLAGGLLAGEPADEVIAARGEG